MIGIQNQRGVGEMYTLDTQVGRPQLERWKYPLAGDERIFMVEPVVIDVASGEVVRLKLEPQQRLSSLCDDLDCDRDGRWDTLFATSPAANRPADFQLKSPQFMRYGALSTACGSARVAGLGGLARPVIKLAHKTAPWAAIMGSMEVNPNKRSITDD